MKLEALTLLAAEEPSKVPFYVAGGVLATWAVVLSAIGLSQEEFPGSPGRARAVMAISAVLVLTTAATAIATSSKHEAGHGEEASEQPGEKAGPPAEPEQPGESGKPVQLRADPGGNLRFDKKTLTVAAGEVKIEFDNPSPVAHDVTVRDEQGELGGTKVITESKATATLQLPKGTYEFLCSVDGHAQLGMRGKLTAR